jgi:hypothetical protein
MITLMLIFDIRALICMMGRTISDDPRRSNRIAVEIELARPRLRPARGIRPFDSAERGAAGFSGLARILERQNHREANAYVPE